MKSQKQCVYENVMKYFTRAKISFADGQNASDFIDTEGRKAIQASIKAEFEAGEVSLKTEMDAEALTKYIPGLVSNHLRKDKRLNGGVEYTPAEPGKFTGNSNPQIKEMRKLLKVVAGTPNEAIVQAGLDKLIAEYKAANNVKTIEIDADLIPAEFKALVG